MKILLLALSISAVVLPSLLWATDPQAGDPNEGSQIEWDETNEVFRLSWWGQAGRTYFLQHSENLVSWLYVPTLIEAGDDAVKEWGFTSTADRFFLRLHYTDIPATDPGGADPDGDGMGSAYELAHGLDPLADDALGDPDEDGVSSLSELLVGRRPDDPEQMGASFTTTSLRVFTPLE